MGEVAFLVGLLLRFFAGRLPLRDDFFGDVIEVGGIFLAKGIISLDVRGKGAVLQKVDPREACLRNSEIGSVVIGDVIIEITLRNIEIRFFLKSLVGNRANRALQGILIIVKLVIIGFPIEGDPALAAFVCFTKSVGSPP